MKESVSSSRGASMSFQGVESAIRRLTSYKDESGNRMELRGSMTRVRAKGGEKVWRADTNRGPRWIWHDGAHWFIGKEPPWAPTPNRPETPKAA